MSKMSNIIHLGAVCCCCRLPHLPVGPYIAIHAMHARPGQQLPAATTSDVNARFTTVVIDSVEAVNATGKYIPVIAHPYLLVDGVVAPL